ncbi:hypothetical protein [Psychrobacter sp. KH172YL61]|uniref:hypothetical protein n=1 Tax=Psychrobacter sp. KH172YL61 TaxID=2517899 RepID=UPI001F07590F|nr:hypothetical protein [Psychrobacter sp. KH172YL61]
MMAKDPKVVIEKMSDFEFSTFIRDTQGSFGVNRQQVKRYLAQSRESSDATAILKDVSNFFQLRLTHEVQYQMQGEKRPRCASIKVFIHRPK